MRPNPSRLLPRLALIGLLGLVSGCLYRMPIQQGNVLDPNQVSQLESGMTRPQVLFLLGTPMVPNGFNNDRWDYYYYVNVGRGFTPVTQRLIVYFKDDKVERVDRTDYAGATPVATPVPPAPAATPPPEVAPAGTPPATGPQPSPTATPSATPATTP